MVIAMQSVRLKCKKWDVKNDNEDVWQQQAAQQAAPVQQPILGAMERVYFLKYSDKWREFNDSNYIERWSFVNTFFRNYRHL